MFVLVYIVTSAPTLKEHLGHVMRKPVLCYMRTTKMQISLPIHAVWSASLLFVALLSISKIPRLASLCTWSHTLKTGLTWLIYELDFWPWPLLAQHCPRVSHLYTMEDAPSIQYHSWVHITFEPELDRTNKITCAPSDPSLMSRGSASTCS